MKNREVIFYNRIENLLAIIARSLVVSCDNMKIEQKMFYKEAINNIFTEE